MTGNKEVRHFSTGSKEEFSEAGDPEDVKATVRVPNLLFILVF